MLTIDHLTAGYGRRVVLDDISVEFRPGRIAGLVGANGSGKSTLLKAAVGLIEAPGARIEASGRIGYMPQHAEIDWDFPATLFDVALMGRTGHLAWWQWPGREDRAAAAAALMRVGLQDKANDPISALSGGQRQRTLLARALASEPEILILDEPFAGVDKLSQDTIVGVLRELRESLTTIVLVHHNLAEVAEFCDDVVLLGPDGIIAAGETACTLDDAAVATLFSLPGAAS
ncbi:metal ABC transporter ATP-binding protein [Corynebacterium liangguodongii]|uniref:Metal ABC transporter ATP-binding protein n=1 Tax=Corynebacterium liangguodongii TaxID=2079535 RepID=A0A2S0WC23_9CORY|nr:ABC transporter ATP-binding protein [Corynebacterium liangguodongii]AWB83315.1 metal ABC transporter ATP-binding protein [Corynebacterium liangguodongii]PWC00595.1 ABC transporter ATP-binding protein [Corynebacterium liangguodongii]